MVIDYLLGILNSIERDVRDVLEFHCASGKGGGYHSIPREVFCYVDHLGQIVYGDHDPNSPIRFLKDRLGKLNSQYVTIGPLVYDMWRNGTVHEYDPWVWTWRKDGNSYEVGWVVSNNRHIESRRLHLQFVEKEFKPGSFGIVINLHELVEDLIRSVKALINDLGASEALRQQCQRNYERISAPEQLPDSLVHQVSEATRNIAGVIDNDGNLVSPHHGQGFPTKAASERDP